MSLTITAIIATIIGLYIPKIISKMDESFQLKIKNLDNFYEKYISNDKNPSKKATQIISEILSK